MQEKVEAYLEQCSHEKKLKEDRYRYLILEQAGLLTENEDYMEITRKEYDHYLKDPSVSVKQEEGKYFIRAKLPLEVTDEEFAAVEREVPEETRNEMKQKACPVKKQRFRVSLILTVVGFAVWIGGLIVAVMSSVTTTNISSFGFTETHFSLQVFLAVLIPYLLYGAVCLFLAEVCKKLNENKQKA